MPKTVQIRDIDDDVYAGLVRRAGEEGITVPELLRREAARLGGPSVGFAVVGTDRSAALGGVHGRGAGDHRRVAWRVAGC